MVRSVWIRRACALAGLVAFACGVPNFSGFDDVPDGAGATGGNGGDAGAGNAAGDGAAGDSGDAGGCTTNADCTIAALPICDVAKKTCVECLPTNDNCPAGTYCAINTCTVGCKSDADCVAAPPPDGGLIDAGGLGGSAGAAGSDGAAGAGGSGGTPGDAGPVKLTCDPVKHLCIGCQQDTDCPIATICDSSNQTCIPGCLTSATCPTGFDCCAKQCANTQTSADHCGACDAACKPVNGTGSCQGGTCAVATCDAGFGDCNADAKDGCESQLSTDASNCGGCGQPCAPAPNTLPECQNGSCKLGACQAGFENCDGNPTNGCEVNLGTSVQNCGACNAACSLLNANAGCASGTCTIASCNAGFGNCDNTASTGCETNTQTNDQHCGACGTVCSFTNAVASCETGSCKISSCVAPYANCDGNTANGCESNKTSDVNNCGSCGNVCLLPHATPKCDGGTCAIASCNSGWADCNGLDSDGCEANLTSSTASCGACGNICGTNNATPTCNAGSCVLNCSAGFANCDGNPANGCEVNTSNSVNNCGICGKVCPGGSGSQPNCVNGVCGISSCTAPLADCNGNAGDGCEVNTSNNPSNCGACGTICFAANGTSTCTSSNCTVATCNAGFGNCDGLYSNGCEKNLKTDPLNCNACGTVCNSTNGSASCSNGVCGITCNSGFANCNGLVSDGCEIPITTTSNCGACGVTCTNAHGGTACTAGACVPTCAAGWANCDGNPNNGCETPTNTATDCGACGVACALPNASSSCTTGSCQIVSCNAGFGNCDGTTSNGCETNLNTSVPHCSACGSACSGANGTPSCSGGSCFIACNAGFANCDGNAKSNGCEVNTQTDPQHCGNCATVCGGGQSCVSGSCQVAGCSPNTADCDGQSSNGCECTTSTCCGASCQVRHCNGFGGDLGQHWNDCSPVGTYTSIQASSACYAYNGSGTCAGFSCGQGSAICSQGGPKCICWGYTGEIAGKVYQSGKGNCSGLICPLSTDPSWDYPGCP